MRPIIGLITAASLLVCGTARAFDAGTQTVPPGVDDADPALVPSRSLRSPDVAEVQRRLKALGYGVGPVDGRLGPKTRTAINAYLTERGLPAIGWISPDLIAEVEVAAKAPPHPSQPKAPSSTIVNQSLRDMDPAKVVVVQTRLKELGFYQGEIDGVVGGGLSDAIKAYQQSKGTPVTGWIFPDLVAEMAAPLKPEPTVAPPVPAPVVIKTWMPKDMVGKTLHDRPGDLLGAVEDVVIDRDGMVAGVVAAITDLYGLSRGETLIPWSEVAASVGRQVVILPMTADQARPFRRNPPPFRIGPDQMLGSRLIGATAKVKGEFWGEVDDAVFEQGGKLTQLKVHGDGDGAPRDVPAADVSLVPADDAVELRDVPMTQRFESDAS